MNDKKNAAQDAAANRAMRPAAYALGAAVVICVLGVILNIVATDRFVAVGGWLTVVGVLFVIAVWAGLSMVRQTNKNAARTDDGDGSKD